jgi:hypothetical protein
VTSRSVEAAEGLLLEEVRRTLPDELAARYRELMERRRAGTLTTEEHRELMRLSDQAEELEAARIRALSELAKLRGSSLADVMEELGIQRPTDA